MDRIVIRTLLALLVITLLGGTVGGLRVRSQHAYVRSLPPHADSAAVVLELGRPAIVTHTTQGRSTFVYKVPFFTHNESIIVFERGKVVSARTVVSWNYAE